MILTQNASRHCWISSMTRLRKEMLDLEDPELVAELAQRYAEEALELMKEEARTAKDSDVRRKAREVVEHYEQARQAHIRRRDSK
ncbi:hypothetical protein D3C85_1365170 [compost metagenome]